MPNIKSSKKTVKTDKVKTVSNTSYTSRVKNGMKRLEKAVKENDKVKANDLLKSTLSNIDKCASKGLMKKNTCDRQKARLNKKIIRNKNTIKNIK